MCDITDLTKSNISARSKEIASRRDDCGQFKKSLCNQPARVLSLSQTYIKKSLWNRFDKKKISMYRVAHVLFIKKLDRKKNINTLQRDVFVVDCLNNFVQLVWQNKNSTYVLLKDCFKTSLDIYKHVNCTVSSQSTKN
jgi:hypothetical protein